MILQDNPLRLALFQPDIPQNTGALLRLSACFALPVDIIEPCGFVFSDAKLRRAGMDYLDRAQVVRHASWQAFAAAVAGQGRRLVLLTTGGDRRCDLFPFAAGDTIMVGRESAVVPGIRSLNVALAAAMAVAEALRQLGAFPAEN